MKRYAVGAIVLIALLAALTSYPDRSSGQDASEARIASWHQSKVELLGLYEQVFKTAAENGLLSVLGFSDAIDKARAQSDQAVVEAAKSCSDFTQFEHDWDALDGDIDGTPVATPTD